VVNYCIFMIFAVFDLSLLTVCINCSFDRATLCSARYMPSSCVCVYVTLRYYIKTAKRRITQIMPQDCFWADTKVHVEILWGLRMQVGWVNIRHFRRKTSYNSTSGSAMAEELRDALVSRNSATTKHPI